MTLICAFVYYFVLFHLKIRIIFPFEKEPFLLKPQAYFETADTLLIAQSRRKSSFNEESQAGDSSGNSTSLGMAATLNASDG